MLFRSNTTFSLEFSLATEALLGGPGEALGKVREPRDGCAHRQVPARRLGALLRRAHVEQVRRLECTN